MSRKNLRETEFVLFTFCFCGPALALFEPECADAFTESVKIKTKTKHFFRESENFPEEFAIFPQNIRKM